jgi:hypothetical protein
MSQTRTFNLPPHLNGGIDEVDRWLATGEKAVILDFSLVRQVSVEALEWMEELMLRAGSASAEVRFENVPPVVYKVFKVAHISSLLTACRASSLAGPVC